MNLYILRHASAGTPRANETLDAKRPIDKEGKQQCVLVANYLGALKVQFDCIASSPLKRAMQTASLVGQEMGYEGEIQVTKALMWNASVADFHKFFSELSGYENVLIVGHNPTLPQFLSSLITTGAATGEAKPKLANIRLRKAGLAKVDCTRRPATLNWLHDVRIMKAIYSSVTKSSRRKTSKK